MDPDLRRLVDRTEISETMSRYFRALDLKDWSAMRGSLGDSLALDFEQLFGDPPAVLSADDFVAFARRVMGGFGPTQHLCGERIIAVEGDHASCSSNMTAWHTVPTPSHLQDTYLVRGRYDAGFERTAAGWRMNALTMTVFDESGDKGLYGVAESRFSPTQDSSADN
jgi:hypothetical protein